MLAVPRAITITPETAALGAQLDTYRARMPTLRSLLRTNGGFTPEEEAHWDETVDQIGKLSAQIRRQTIERGRL